MKWRALAVLCAIAVSAPLHAQKACKKGIPCGNTCIAANKVCHIATPSTDTAKTPAKSDSSSASSATAGQWVASKIGRTYYKAGCSGANKLKAGNVVTFATEQEAQKAGYTRSRAKGC